MTVSKQIIEVLDTLCAKFGIAVDWTSDNIIPYVTSLIGKLVTFEIWTSVAWIVFMLIPVIAWIVFLKKTWASNHDDVDYAIPVEMCSVFGSLVALAAFITQTMDIIKCVTFPELFVYEYVLRFIENMH